MRTTSWSVTITVYSLILDQAIINTGTTCIPLTTNIIHLLSLDCFQMKGKLLLYALAALQVLKK